MKIAVLKLGSRISFNANDISGGSGETGSIIKMLHLGGVEVHIYTKILSTDNLLPEYKWHNLSEPFDLILSGIDALVVLNGNCNFFDGKEDVEQLMNYAIINSFGGPVYYILCDPELTFTQVWPDVAQKDWSDNWSKGMLQVERSDIIYASQSFEIEKVINSLSIRDIKPSKIVHFPFEKLPCLNEQLPFNKNPEVDLSYGSTMGNGKCAKKMVKFYLGHPEDISVEMFGKIGLDDFLKIEKIENQVRSQRPPSFTGTINYDKMPSKMNKVLAHCVISDPWSEEINYVSQGIYESIWSSVVTFIDSDSDKLRWVYGKDKVLADFLYVSDRTELSEKIQLLKTDTGLRRQIIENQISVIQFDAHEYCRSFIKVLQEV